MTSADALKALHELAALDPNPDTLERLQRARREQLRQTEIPSPGAFAPETLAPGLTQLNVPGDGAKLDLSSEVSVFVTTVGAPDFSECMRCLFSQDCLFRLYVIKELRPMSTAFQCMHDLCTTPYYVQVDEDMLLYPHAVRTLSSSIADRPSEVAAYYKGLYDLFTGFNLVGVKIYRHDIVKRYPYDPRDFSCETPQVERMKKDGYRIEGHHPGLSGDRRHCLGDLNAYWTPAAVFAKYYRDLQKVRLYPNTRRDWMLKLPALFLEKLKSDPDDQIALFALAGAIAGLTGPVEATGEKDFKEDSYRELCAVIADGMKVDLDQVFDVRTPIAKA